jgi:outer membrane receptor protein involved in Fe transport
MNRGRRRNAAGPVGVAKPGSCRRAISSADDSACAKEPRPRSREVADRVLSKLWQSSAAPRTFDIRNPSSVQGEPLPLSPENKVSATLTYRLPLSESVGELSMGVNYSYTDEQITSSNSPYGTLPAYELVNLNLTWKRIAGSAFDASLFMTNALDEEYTVYVPGLYNSVGAEFRQVGMPKMWGGRLRYSFGGND